MWNISFISEEDFQKNIKDTVLNYFGAMNSVDLYSFNSNIIDPIKLIFDMKVYGKTPESLIDDEINRQIDKTNSNSIGYFNQYMFKYIQNCEVPTAGFDVIYTNPNTGKRIYVEMKNKHNTMNSDSSNNVFNKMINKLADDPDGVCYLVEVIATRSQNIVWSKNRNTDERIRRVSIDQFYYEVTGVENAFKQLCDKLPEELDIVIRSLSTETNGENTVLNQLSEYNPDIIKSMFLLAFNSYKGFNED